MLHVSYLMCCTALRWMISNLDSLLPKLDLDVADKKCNNSAKVIISIGRNPNRHKMGGDIEDVTHYTA